MANTIIRVLLYCHTQVVLSYTSCTVIHRLYCHTQVVLWYTGYTVIHKLSNAPLNQLCKICQSDMTHSKHTFGRHCCEGQNYGLIIPCSHLHHQFLINWFIGKCLNIWFKRVIARYRLTLSLIALNSMCPSVIFSPSYVFLITQALFDLHILHLHIPLSYVYCM